MLIVLIVNLKERQYPFSAPNEIWMVRVDVSVLNLNETHNHVERGLQTFIQNLLHHINNLRLQSVVFLELWDLHVDYYFPQLLVHLLCAIEGWLQESHHLLLHYHVEGCLGDEEAAVEGAGILDCYLYVCVS